MIKGTKAGDPSLLNIQAIAYKSRESAFAYLFNLWNIPYNESGNEPCSKAESFGLRCIDGRVNIRDLLSLNRLAVLRLLNNIKTRLLL